MNKQINSELLSMLKTHLAGQRDAANGNGNSYLYPYSPPILLKLINKAYYVAYNNPLNKTLTYANKEKAI